MGEINKIALYLLAIAIGAGLSSGFSQFFIDIAAERIGIRVKYKYFQQMIKQEIGFFDRKKTGNLVSHLSEDATSIKQIMSSQLSNILANATQTLMGLVIALLSSWQMSLVMLACAPVMLVSIAVTSKVMRKTMASCVDKNSLLKSLLKRQVWHMQEQ